MQFKTVPPQLPASTPCRIALIGDMPDSYDVMRGKPFIGPNGHILDQMLRVAGIERSDCLLTNVFNSRPPSATS